MFGHTGIVNSVQKQEDEHLGLTGQDETTSAEQEAEIMALNTLPPRRKTTTTSDLRTHLSVLKFFKHYHPIWSSKGTGSKFEVTFYRLRARLHVSVKFGGGHQDAYKAGFRMLGDLACPSYKDVSKEMIGTFMVKEKGQANFEEFVRKPLDYKRIWTDAGTGSRQRCAIWQPIPPPGFVALGCIVTENHETPDTDLVRCVHHSLTEKGKISATAIWNEKKTGAKKTVSIWGIEPLDEDVGINANLFVAINSHSKPVGTPRVLSKRYALMNVESEKPIMPKDVGTGIECPKCNGCGKIGVFGPSTSKLDNPSDCPTCSATGKLGENVNRCPTCSGEGGRSPFGFCSSNSLFYEKCTRCKGRAYIE